MKAWTENAIVMLQGCFDCILWNVFLDSSADIDELNDVVSSWVTYCLNSVFPEKNVKLCPNSKPWVSKHLKCLLTKKRSAFYPGDLLEVKNLQKQITLEIKRAKRSYKDKVESKLRTNCMSSVWDSLK